MTGYVDLHSHYVPGVDDGVTSIEEGRELCLGLASLGFSRIVATPHMRTAMFDNRAPGLRQAFAEFEAATADTPGMPQTGLAAEHFCDDVVLSLLGSGEGLPYPGGHAALLEFPAAFPLGIEQKFFELQVKGLRPVLAHPERYRPLFRDSEAVQRMRDMGVALQLDVMSLVGKYGRAPRRAAERMLEEQLYFLACSDCHRPGDVPTVGKAIERLRALAGQPEADRLLGDNPRSLLDGTAEP